jgi:hypothetical protein
MGTIHDVARPPDSQRRKYRRFGLRCAVLVEFSSGSAIREVQTVSKNVSVGGLLLQSPSALPESQPLSFTLTVDGGSMVRPIKFLGEGRVVRVEPHGPSASFTVAVECTHPISQMEDYLAGSAN